MEPTLDRKQKSSASSSREFLATQFEQKKRRNPRFSFRRFSQIVGFASPNYLQMILRGERTLTLETAEKVARGLQLSAAESQLFFALVRLDSAKTAQEKRSAEQARLLAIKKIVTKEIPAAQKFVLNKWYPMLIRELFLLKDARREPSWIVERLGGLITEAQAEEAVELLLKSGFLIEKGHRLFVAEAAIETLPADFQRAFMQQFHSQVLKAWSENLTKLPHLHQELCVLNIPISSERIGELRNKIQQFQDEIIGWVQNDDQADQVVQLGTYLIPFSDAQRFKDKKSKKVAKKT